MDRRSRVGPVGAAVRSMLIPGWGHVAAGRRRVGWPLLVATAAVTGVVLAIGVALGPTEIVARLADPTVLTGLLVVDVLVAGLRLIPTLHVWAVAGGSRSIGLVLIAALVLAPHAAIGYVGLETRQTLETVFATPPVTAPPSSTTAPTTTTPPTTTTVGLTSTVPPPTTVPVTPITPIPDDERVTVLLLGGDAGPGRSGLRTDSVIVATVHVASGASAVFSLPRNWGGLPLADGSTVPGRMLNEVYAWARPLSDRFPGLDPGAVAVVEVASQITGLEIDHYALVDLTGFADVVDALGGLTIDVPRSVYGPSYEPSTGRYTMIRIPSGIQELDGRQALAYVRERYQSSDYDRMDRQRCVLAALADSTDTITLLRGIRGILGAVERHVTTDIPLDRVSSLIRIAGRVDTATMQVVGFDNSWRRGWDRDGHAIPDIDRIRAAVAEAIDDAGSAEARFELAGETCG